METEPRAKGHAVVRVRQEETEGEAFLNDRVLEDFLVKGCPCVVLGSLRSDEGDQEGAIAAYRRALELLPVNDRYQLAVSGRLAEVLRASGRNDEALDVLANAVRSQAAERRPA